MTPLDAFAVPLRGVRLIEANAGTGKTYTITTLYLRLLLERGLEVGQILVVTYTNAATAELRRKVRERVAALLDALGGGAGGGDQTVVELARRRRLGGSAAADARRLEAALYGFDEAAIFTIHGLCQRVLQEHALESGVAFDAELIGDERLLVDDVVRDFWTRELYAAPADFVRALAQAHITPAGLGRLARLRVTHPDLRLLPARAEVDAAAGRGGPDAALDARCLHLQLDCADWAPRELRRRKEASGTQSFDDLLQCLAGALAGPGGEALARKMRARFPAALIDEFQDTDPVQAQIFERVYRHPEAALFLVGDPKQAIYGFRGADVFTYVAAKQRVGDDAYALAVNRRSGAALVRAVNALFEQAHAPFVLPGIPFFPSQPAEEARDALAGDAAGHPPLRFLFVARTGRRPQHRGQIKRGPAELGWYYGAIAGEITRLLNADTRIGEQRVGPGDVAVLCRTNRQCAELQARLAALGVPSVIYGDTSVFDTPEAGAVERVMRAMADPGDGAALAAALLTPLVGLTGNELAAARADERLWEGWTECFRRLGERWKTSGFAVAFRHLLDDQGVPGRLLSRYGGERAITNTLHLGELLQAAAVDGRRGPLALVEWLQRMRGDETARGEEAAESAQIRLESDTHALKLITIHKSKGLQFPVVFCPFLWDGVLLRADDARYVRFHAGDSDALTLDLGSADIAAHRARCKREALAEHLRLLYVALTRAKQLCVVAWGRFNGSETSALGYLLHQPRAPRADDLIEATKTRIEQADDAQLRADLERLAAAAGDGVEIAELADAEPPPFAAPAQTGGALALCQAKRQVEQTWWVASFSALAAGDRPLPEPAEEGVDRDELTDAGQGDVPATVRGFPRGRRLGSLVHKLFESIDFSAPDQSALREQAARLLPLYGVETQWSEAICGAIGDVLDTPLNAEAPPLLLRHVRSERRLNELEFVFPVALGGGAALTADALAAAFAAQGAPWLASDYAPRVRQLPVGRLSGYLKGFIDLVFVHGKRWFVVDYKTNDLGPHPDDYRPARLLAEMQRHHYVLQYHLYAVALHRYLERRLAGYDYARDFGGVLYLFVRGMAPAHRAGCGVFADRPSAALIEALSAVLAGQESPAGAAPSAPGNGRGGA